MIGTENEVPCLISHTVGSRESPKIPSPGSRTSGLGTPIPSSNARLVIPLELNGATSSNIAERLPTPTTVLKSPGFSTLPYQGPSFPIAETTITPAAASSSIFSIKGMSKESLLAVDRFTMSMSLSRIQLKASTNQELYVMSSDVKSFKMNISDSGAIPGQS